MALKPFGLDFVQEVLGDVGADAFDALGHFDQHRHLGGRLRQACRGPGRRGRRSVRRRRVDGVLVDVQFDQARLEVQRQGGAIADGLFEAVAAHVAVLVFVGAKGVEGVAVAAVDGRARQPEQEGVRQGGAHLHPQVAFLGAVGFVDQDDDVLTVVQHAVGFAKFEDGGDDDLARVLAQQGFQFLARIRL